MTIIHRREVDIEQLEKDMGELTEEQKSKLTQHKIDMSKVKEESELFKGHHVTFCVLGTTRDAAKSADNFRKVDLYMVRDAGIASKQAG